MADSPAALPETTIRIERGVEAVDLIADQIERLAAAAELLTNTGLTERAILILLRDRTGLGIREIRLVLRALPELREYVAKDT